MGLKKTYETISAMFTANLPTLVPPYFCTSHLDEGSMLFWYALGGVRGGDEEGEEADEYEPDDEPLADIWGERFSRSADAAQLYTASPTLLGF